MNIKEAKGKIIIFAVCLLVVGLIFLPGYTKLQKLKSRNKKLLNKIDKLKNKNNQLAKEQKRLKQDSSYIEKLAREELGLARDGEIIYKIEKKNQVESNK